MDTYPVTVADVIQETPRDRSLVLALDAAGHAAAGFAPGTFQPGQAVALVDPAGDGKPRYYSVSAPPDEAGRFAVTIRCADEGPVPHCYGLDKGHALQTSAPMGAFVLDLAPGEDLVLCAAGSGIAPFRAFVLQLLQAETPPQVTVVHSVRTAEDLTFAKTFRSLMAEHAWLRYVPTLTAPGDQAPPPGTRTGRVDRGLLATLLPRPQQTAVYACGPGSFVEHVLSLAEGLGVDEAHRRRERW